jgi:alpha-D-ribose 1-methylphosphonate 5-triphosphate synthase subunit PhnG
MATADGSVAGAAAPKLAAEPRLEGLAMCHPEALEALADDVLATAGVEIVHGPEVAVAPLRVPGAEGAGGIVVGRVPVTRCTLELEGVRGDAIFPGRAIRAALAAAVLDAEAERGGPAAVEVEAMARAALERRLAALDAEAAGVAATRTEEAG